MLAGAGCYATERPLSPWRLEGFPGAPVEGDWFPLAPGAIWRFEERIDPKRRGLELRLLEQDGVLVLEGLREEAAQIARNGEFLEISRDGELLDRPLRFGGTVGESWKFRNAKAMTFGFDRLEALGTVHRALVVAVDRDTSRGREREIHWFVEGIGWARLRTEREGRVLRDATLVAFQPGARAD